MPRQFPHPLLPLLHSTAYPQLPSVSDLENIRQALAEYAYSGSGLSGSGGNGGGLGGPGGAGGAGVEGGAAGTPGAMGDDVKKKDRKRKEREDEDREKEKEKEKDMDREKEGERERAAIEANERASMRLEVAEKARLAHAQGVAGKKKGLSAVAGKGSSSTASPTGVKVKRERSCE